MIYFPVPWIHRINPVPWLPLDFAPFSPAHPSKPSPRVGRTPLGLITMNRGEPLAHKPWPSGQEAHKVAGSGLGKWRDREMG